MPQSQNIARILQYLERQPKALLWLEAIALVLLVGFVDYRMGYEVSVVLFYSLPILLMVWCGDKMSGVFVALLSAIVWWWSDESLGHPYPDGWHHIWETAVRLGFFLSFAAGSSAIKAHIALLEQSRRLKREIIRISEREQQRMGQDLHDGLCQYFAAVGCAAGSLRRNLEKHGAPQARDAGEIEDLIMKGVVQTRSLARGLFPVEDQEDGLQCALQTLADSASRLLNVNCILECEEPVPVHDNVRATHLYRIAQESISNASRHGKAETTRIRLTADKDRVSLTISDNGIGICPDLPRGNGMGLGIMEYRARMIGGEFEIVPAPDGGTVVRCSFSQKP